MSRFREKVVKISTGSKQFDSLLGGTSYQKVMCVMQVFTFLQKGGVQTMSITEGM